MENKIVTVIGGTGFVGRYTVKLLAAKGYTIRVIARNPDLALHLKTAGEVGQIALVPGNLAKPESLLGKLDHSWAVINLAGILFESTRQDFSLVHAKGAEKLAQLAKAAGAERFVHVSSLGVDKMVKSKYARTKAMGEKAVRAAFAEAVVLRPSVIFGAEDQFFNAFASMARLNFLPVIGGGETKFQPVYVGDVARAVLACLKHSVQGGNIYELGGPEIYSFRELLDYVCKATGRSPFMFPIPFGLAGLIGYLTQLLPHPPITHDQVAMLEHDSVVNAGAKTFADLGISPVALETVVPQYLMRFAKAGMLAA